MAEFTSVALQTVATNGNVLFTETPVSGCKRIYHREGSGQVTLKGSFNGGARYLAFFSGNIAVPTGGTIGEISLALALNGEAVLSSEMESTPTAVADFNNVSTAIYVNLPCGICDATLSVRNTSDVDIAVENANLIIVPV